MTNSAGRWLRPATLFFFVSICSQQASAAENGQSHANLGYLDFLAGFEPPPGFYFRNDVIGVVSGTLSDRTGSPVGRHTPLGTAPVSFQSTAPIELATFYYVTPFQLFGANFATAVLVPYKNQDVSVSTPLTGSNRSNVTGLGDIIIAPQLGWHFPQWNLHITAGPTFYVPTGEYNSNDPVGNNIGHNFLSSRSSTLPISTREARNSRPPSPMTSISETPRPAIREDRNSRLTMRSRSILAMRARWLLLSSANR
jgi:hypothetical protein